MDKIVTIEKTRVMASPCRECPFRRKSAPSYLGSCSGDPWAFLKSFAHGEERLACHMTVNWEVEDPSEQEMQAPLCRGALTMLKNSATLPREPVLAQIVRQMEPDSVNIMADTGEFMKHHHNSQLAASFRKMRRSES